eukprot:1244631-Rhodomonas_salina.1
MQHWTPVPAPEAEALSCSATVSNLGQQCGQSQRGGCALAVKRRRADAKAVQTTVRAGGRTRLAGRR